MTLKSWTIVGTESPHQPPSLLSDHLSGSSSVISKVLVLDDIIFLVWIVLCPTHRGLECLVPNKSLAGLAGYFQS